MNRHPKPAAGRHARRFIALGAISQWIVLVAVHAVVVSGAHAEEPKAVPGTPAVAAPADGKAATPAIVPAKPVDATKPAGAAKPADPAKPAEAAKKSAPVKATTPAKPTEPSKAQVPAKPPAATVGTPPAAPPVAPAPAGGAAVQPAPAADPAKSAPPTSSPEAEAVWRAYEKRWSETEDYSAGFRQVIEVPDVGSKVESAGRFYFAKPGLVRWDYTEGPPQAVVGDGTWIWLYQPDLEQVYKIPYAKAFGRGGLVELLAGREGVSERYITSIERPDPATVRILLKSLTEGGGNLEVTLENETFDLRAVTVHDAAGSITSMTFAEPRRNQGADRERFTFTPPPAVDIISDNEAGF